MMAAVDKLWRAYSDCRSVRNRNVLVMHYGHLVHTYAARLSQKLPAQVTYDDICSAAFDGLIEAVETFDPTRKTKFTTFCQRRIPGAVIDWLRETDHLCRHVRRFESARDKIVEAEMIVTGRRPDEREVCKRMGMSDRRYRRLSDWAAKARLAQLSNFVSDKGHQDSGRSRARRPANSDAPGLGFADPRARDPSERSLRAEFREWILRGMNRAERLTLILYYYENMSQAEIAPVLGVSESRVSLIRRELLARLRGRMNPGAPGF